MARFPLNQFSGTSTLVMGILNVTLDSFSDGGAYPDVEAAIDAGLKMISHGAHVIDVGGESTRPGAAPISVEQEIKRVLPVIEGLCAKGVAVSIDTYKPLVAREAVAVGARIINDITAGEDPRMLEIAAQAACPIILMHMKGTPRTMQKNPVYEDVSQEVAAYLKQRVETCKKAGIAPEMIVIDPGIGFGKTASHNLELLRNIACLTRLGPVLVGTSRKSFIGAVLDAPVHDRLAGTAATIAYLVLKGVDAVRVHDVRDMARVCKMIQAITQEAE